MKFPNYFIVCIGRGIGETFWHGMENNKQNLTFRNIKALALRERGYLPFYRTRSCGLE